VAGGPARVEVSSRVEAPAPRVWERVIPPEGINDEMRPWMKMTIPRGIESFSLDSVTLGERIGRSWILLGGILPIEYDDVTLVELDEGHSFLERSPMMSMRLWEHGRTIEPDGESACTVTDRLRLEPKLRFLTPVAARTIKAFFGHRHRRLQRYFA